MEKRRKQENAKRRSWRVGKISFGFYAVLAKGFSLHLRRVRGREARRCTPKFGTVLTALTIRLFKPENLLAVLTRFTLPLPCLGAPAADAPSPSSSLSWLPPLASLAARKHSSPASPSPTDSVFMVNADQRGQYNTASTFHHMMTCGNSNADQCGQSTHVFVEDSSLLQAAQGFSDNAG